MTDMHLFAAVFTCCDVCMCSLKNIFHLEHSHTHELVYCFIYGTKTTVWTNES